MGLITQLSTITKRVEHWAPLLQRIEAQAPESHGLRHGISDMYGPCLAVSFSCDDIRHVIYPDQDMLFVGDTKKVIKLAVDDDWVQVRLKIAKAPLRLDGPAPEPGPDLVQWLRQRMSHPIEMEAESDSDWTFERCIREAASHLLGPPDQPSTPDLQESPAVVPERPPPGSAEELRLRLIEFGLSESDAFGRLLPFLRWAKDQSEDINDKMWDFFFEAYDTDREAMLDNWGVKARNDGVAHDVRTRLSQVETTLRSTIRRWERGRTHTADMAQKFRASIQEIFKLNDEIRRI